MIATYAFPDAALLHIARAAGRCLARTEHGHLSMRAAWLDGAAECRRKSAALRGAK